MFSPLGYAVEVGVGTSYRDQNAQRTAARGTYRLLDERGLFLLVTPAGGRLWRFRSKLGAIEKLISLGAYPDIALKRAGSNVTRAVDS